MPEVSNEGGIAAQSTRTKARQIPARRNGLVPACRLFFGTPRHPKQICFLDNANFGTRSNRHRSVVLVCFLLLVATGLLLADTLKAGAAQSVITPELGGHTVHLAGFGHNRVATGIHDDLYASCLALGVGAQNLVLCSADLIGLFYDDVLTIRRAFQTQVPGAT
jgi:hypothetical protein